MTHATTELLEIFELLFTHNYLEIQYLICSFWVTESFSYLFDIDPTAPADSSERPFHPGGLQQDGPARPERPVVGRAVAPPQSSLSPPPLPPAGPPSSPPTQPNLCTIPHPPMLEPPPALQLLPIPLVQEVVHVPDRRPPASAG